MTSSLPTVKQIKFNEALYILKTFGVEGNNDFEKIKALGQLLNGKKVPEIFALADEVAKKNGIDWASNAPPSLGEMDIFGDDAAKEHDPNDIKASSLSILTKIAATGANGDQAIQVLPRLVDTNDTPISFDGAALETTMEVSSNGVKLLTAKNLMQNNNFNGFTLKYGSLPAEKITDDAIDITITVKTTDKTFKMSKMGLKVNPLALKQPVLDNTEVTTGSTEQPAIDADGNPIAGITGDASPTKDPKATVTKFLGNLNAQNLRGAYESSANSNWGSFDNFSNPTSGFGAVKSVNVKNVQTATTSPETATVNANYDVTDKEGKTIPLSVTFGLKNMNGEWKISSYKINK